MIDQDTVLRMQRVVNAVVSKLNPPAETVEDCKQAGILAVYDAWRTWDETKGVAFVSWAWFYIVKAVNREAHFFKDFKNKINILEVEDEEFRVVGEEELEADVASVSAMLPELSSKQQDVLMLFVEGKTFAEISEELDITRQASHRLYKRAVRAIQRILEESLDSKQVDR